MRLIVTGLLASVILTNVATALQEVQSTGALAKAVTDALQDGDAEGLADLVDFEARSLDGRARGTVPLDWAKADAMDRLMERQATAEAWIEDRKGFLEEAFLYQFTELADPEAGTGPVPDRLITQVVLKATRKGKLMDMLVISTDDLRLLDLVFGEPYYPDANPLGPEGLQPSSHSEPQEQGVRWPDEVADYEREDARELVGDLLDHSLPSDRKRTIEYLHREPQSAAAALVERLLAEQEASTPDTASQEMLIDALVTITGRDSDFRAHPEFNMDEGTWMAKNKAEVMGWLRWHSKHGGSFGAAPIIDPLSASYDERSSERASGRRNPSEAAASGADGGGASGSLAGGAPPTAPEPSNPEPPSGGALASGAGADRMGDPASGAGGPSGDPAGSGDAGTDDLPSRVRFRKPSTPEIGPLSSSGAALTLLKVPPPDVGSPEEVSAESLVDVLPKGIAKALNHWAGAIEELDLRVAWGGDEEFLVLGRADDDILVDSLQTLAKTRDLLLDTLPDIRSPKTVDPVVVIVVDYSSREGTFWGDLINAMLVLDRLEFAKADTLSSGPVGFYNRVEHVFVQPTWDIAGNAAAGDDEFRLHNELAHKLAGCLAYERCGHLPEGLYWALGHLAEVTLFDSVYQFNKSGFVSAGDHFDWPRKARQVLERRSRRRNFVLSQQVLDSGETSSDIDGHLLAWAVMDYLSLEHPADLTQLFRDLFELHKEARPYGGARAYEGDPETTREVLDLRLGSEAVDALVDHLESRQ